MSEQTAIADGEAKPLSLRIRCIQTIEDVDREAWDGLDQGPSPFLSYGFLRALEVSGSIGSGSGWHPFYLLAEPDCDPEDDGGTDSDRTPLLGAVPAFVKSHSYGEYIFDWSWAGASERAGLAYYPKLVVAAPMTPATGKRMLLSPALGKDDVDKVRAALVFGLKELADQADCSSIHWLFCTQEEQAFLAELGFSSRSSYQFHWHNRSYRDYDAFLAQLSSRKRKQLRKERRRALESLDGPVSFRCGGELAKEELAAMDRYYRSTVYAHGGMDYLRPGFFREVAREMPEVVQFAHARKGNRLVAGALFFQTEKGLYGRYWGCDDEIEFLHFETAYYAGIERCIAHGIPLFEAGAQGEHKLLRGFLPSPTYSSHWMRHPELHRAVGEFVKQEVRTVRQRMAWLTEQGPYKCEE